MFKTDNASVVFKKVSSTRSDQQQQRQRAANVVTWVTNEISIFLQLYGVMNAFEYKCIPYIFVMP